MNSSSFFSPGVRYMLLAGFVFSLMTVCVKELSRIPVMEIIFFRSLVSYIICIFSIKKQGLPMFGNQKSWLLVRGLAGTVALVGFFMTVKHLPLATAVTLQYLSPIFTALVALLLGNERLRPLQWFFFAVSFCGVALIKGISAEASMLYIGLGIVSSVFSGIAYNSIKKLKSSDHPMVIVSYFPLVALPVSGLWLLFEWQTPSLEEWLWLLLTGVLTQYAQYFMTLAYRAEALSKIASVNYVGIVYAVGFGYVLFNETISGYVLLGILLVLAGVLMSIQYGQRMVSPASQE